MAAPSSDELASYLTRPYARIVIPETDGTYRGEILEFLGCIATGDTAVETLSTLEEIAVEWLRAALERDQPIPDPVEHNDFSGRLVLRMPKSLHKKAARLAELDGVSLNHFIVTSLAEQIGGHARARSQITFNATISNVPMGPAVSAIFTHHSVVHTSDIYREHIPAGVSPWIRTPIPIRQVKYARS